VDHNHRVLAFIRPCLDDHLAGFLAEVSMEDCVRERLADRQPYALSHHLACAQRVRLDHYPATQLTDRL
jgi:hypothetical protein